MGSISRVGLVERRFRQEANDEPRARYNHALSDLWVPDPCVPAGHPRRLLPALSTRLGARDVGSNRCHEGLATRHPQHRRSRLTDVGDATAVFAADRDAAVPCGTLRPEREADPSAPPAHSSAPSSSGLGHDPLKVETRVRIPLGLPAPARGFAADMPRSSTSGFALRALKRRSRAWASRSAPPARAEPASQWVICGRAASRSTAAPSGSCARGAAVSATMRSTVRPARNRLSRRDPTASAASACRVLPMASGGTRLARPGDKERMPWRSTSSPRRTPRRG